MIFLWKGPQICILKKSCIHIPPKSTKSNRLKNNNSCKVPSSFTICRIFISLVQQVNDKLRLVMWSIAVSELEIKCEFGGFLICMNHLLSDFYEDWYLVVRGSLPSMQYLGDSLMLGWLRVQVGWPVFLWDIASEH